MLKHRISGVFFILLLCFGLAMTLSAGTTGKIAGRVVDAETGTPLIGANIMIEGTQLGASVDLNGDYYILNVLPGSYTVVASMMGYNKVRQTDIEVNVDRTVKVDFKLTQTAIEGQTVTIVATRDIVRMDVSASQSVADAEQVAAVPVVMDVQQFVNLQVGVENNLIRGGGMDQIGLVVDGMAVVDNESNEPMMMVNLSALKEVDVIKGGFNAEYGNIRSGLINIVSKDGSPTTYHGNVDFRYTLPALKHRGASLYDPENFYLSSYLDPAVCWVGTANGSWDEYTQQQNPEFEGWNAVSERLLSDNDPTNDLTPEQARDLFIWQHRAEGSDVLGHPHPGKYGDKPDFNIDASFGGPVPFIGKFLGNMTFFGSYRINIERPILPTSTDRIYERNAMFKLSSILSSSIKLGVEGILGKQELPDGGGLPNAYNRGIYYAHGASPMTIDRRMAGLTFDHILNPSMFYTVRVSVVNKVNHQSGAETLRDLTTLRSFGGVSVDEQPWGFNPNPGYEYAIADQMILGGTGGGGLDETEVTTLNARADLTSQIDKYNQVKAGFEVNVDDYNVMYGEQGLDPTGDFIVEWKQTPIRGGVYVQDKLEFQGMIANLGLRADYNDPNTDWYTLDRYSKYFARQFKDQFTEKTPTEPAKGHLKISPRLGISHPITAVSKLYFNYGHFYSMPTSEAMYMINYGLVSSGILSVGNPNAQLPRTISYELGYEHEIAGMFLIGLAGYYKDVSDQSGTVQYVNYDGSVNYSTYDNSHYADIRGFEIRLEKNWGSWVTGWLNYNYMVETNGYYGREVYYQDPRQQAVYGLRNPKQEKPLARPYARANIQVMTPPEWGPAVLGFQPLSEWSVSLLFQYKSGMYQTWEPVAPFTQVDNVHWKDNFNFDLRLNKRVNVGRINFQIFADVLNVFDLKSLTGRGFRDEYDYRDYMNSLHLPMYSAEKYQSQGFVAGDDKPGDVRSDDKPYINMPNIDFQSWNTPRSIILGIKVDF